jgi:hypothetical protein
MTFTIPGTQRYVLEGYCDANWISDADDIHAISEYIFLLGGGAVS